jgi:glycine/D-amino acid oxidase-like deaminating enzyme
VAFLANAGVHVALFELASAGAAAQSTAVGGIAMAGLGSCY